MSVRVLRKIEAAVDAWALTLMGAPLPIAPVAPAANTLITDSLTEDYLHPIRQDSRPGRDNVTSRPVSRKSAAGEHAVSRA
jgi:hypothetical protein